jgi:para-nitrobenzyl esterase
MDSFQKATLADMRALPFDTLIKMANEYGAVTKKRIMWWPIIDGYVLTGTFSEVARKNEIADVPYMIGFTANDLSDMTKPVADFCALRAEKSKKPAYAYIFARPLPGDSTGAFHSADLWYIFHSFRHSWRPFTAGDEALSLQIVDYWTNFAKYGDPNGKDGGSWTPYTKETPKFIILDVEGDKAVCSMSDSTIFRGAAKVF